MRSRTIQSYYLKLGVPEGSDHHTIKKAYRTKAKQLHPDLNKSPNSQQHFREVHQAYNYLINHSPQELTTVIETERVAHQHAVHTYQQYQTRPNPTYAPPPPRTVSKNKLAYQRKLDRYVKSVRIFLIVMYSLTFAIGVIASFGDDEIDTAYILSYTLLFDGILTVLFILGFQMKYNRNKKY